MIQRDNKPGLPYAGMWDLPGGGREGNETPLQCAAREVREELGIAMRPESVIFENTYPMRNATRNAYFMIAVLDDADIQHISFGDEGQGWKMMSVQEFLVSVSVVPVLQARFREALDI